MFSALEAREGGDHDRIVRLVPERAGVLQVPVGEERFASETSGTERRRGSHSACRCDLSLLQS